MKKFTMDFFRRGANSPHLQIITIKENSRVFLASAVLYVWGQLENKFNSHFLYRIAENSRAISTTHFGSVKIFFLKNLGHITIVFDKYVSINILYLLMEFWII